MGEDRRAGRSQQIWWSCWPWSLVTWPTGFPRPSRSRHMNDALTAGSSRKCDSLPYTHLPSLCMAPLRSASRSARRRPAYGGPGPARPTWPSPPHPPHRRRAHVPTTRAPHPACAPVARGLEHAPRPADSHRHLTCEECRREEDATAGEPGRWGGVL